MREIEALAFSFMYEPRRYGAHFVDAAVSDSFPDGGHVDIDENNGLIVFVRNAEYVRRLRDGVIIILHVVEVKA